MKKQLMSGPPLVPADFRKLDRSAEHAPEYEEGGASPLRELWRRLRASKLTVASLLFLCLLALFAAFAPWLISYDPEVNDLYATHEPPSMEHWFGTDGLGRDIFARIWTGARVSLQVGIYAALIDVIIGIVYGGIMGYVGGMTDKLMNRLAEILYAIPYLLIVILLLVIMEPSLWTIIVALTVTGWIQMAWIVRGQVMQLKQQEYVLAAQALGAGFSRILFRHLLPGAAGPILVTLTLTVPSAIFAEAFLSFLGLGVQSPAASWGMMLQDALPVWKRYPWELLLPAGMISLTMLAFNLLGDGLRDAADTGLKER